MKKKIKISYISGTRADYGLMRHTLKEMDQEFDLNLIVTGMHLQPEFGRTIKEIIKDGFHIAAKISIPALSKIRQNNMARTFGIMMERMAKEIPRMAPELIVVLGDRGEALAGALTGMYSNIPVAHIHGGDQGDGGAHIDDSIRHATTKFSHLHLAATTRSAERIIKMGEEKWRVSVVGSPALVEILSDALISREDLFKRIGLNIQEGLLLVVQHPVLTQAEKAGWQMRQTLDALADLKMQTVLIYPNSDTGGRDMIKVIEEYKKYPWLRVFKSLPRKEYLSIMKYSNVMIGNSSSGTVDAPAFKLPVVNIGVRESVRENAGNKIYVPHDRDKLKKAVKKCLFDKKFIQLVKKNKSPYGDGQAHLRIIKIIKSYFPLSSASRQKLLVKKLTY